MTTHRSRTADPLPDAPTRAAMGTWGLWLTITVLTTGLAGLASAALYLHSGQPAWPPDGIAVAPVGGAVVGVVLAATALAATLAAGRRLAAGSPPAVAPLLMLATGAAAASTWMLVADLLRTPFRWDEHAYTSVHWVLTGAAATFVGVGTLMLAAVLVQRLTGVLDPRRMLELDVTLAYLWFATVGAGILLVLVHLLPDPGGVP